MAIEKRIQLEDDDAISAPLPTEDAEEVTVTPDGGAEITITDQQEIEAAEAMGLMDEEPMQMFGPFDANLADTMAEEDIDKVSSDLLEGFEKDKESREEYDEIAEEGVNLLG